MSDPLTSFSRAAQGLARNPLGIIALFIVLVYGFAALLTGFAGSFSPAEKIPLIYFMVVFPVLVLGIFAWLVSRHSTTDLQRVMSSWWGGREPCAGEAAVEDIGAILELA